MIQRCLPKKIVYITKILKDLNLMLGNKIKFDYKRMVIDQSGDGEFVEKKKNNHIEVRRRDRRSLEPQYPTDEDAYDGPKKMASRAAREVDEPTRVSTC